MNACTITLKQAIRRVACVPGDIAEIGVWQGASALVLLEHTTDGDIYLYDTFCGMPEEMCTANVDYHTKDSFRDTSITQVARLLQPQIDRVVFRPGVFPDSAKFDRGPFRLIHIDCDLYLSTKAAIEWAVTRLSPGGVILDDDYGCGSTAGAKKAIDEWYSASDGSWFVERIGSRVMISQVPQEANCAN